jgi:acyl carrier protein
MTHEEIYTSLASIFEDIFEYEGELSPETIADDVEGWDSVGHIRLVLACEQAFGVRFKPNEVVGLNNLGELVDALVAKAA